MRRCLCGLVMALSSVAMLGQDAAKVEIFGGFSYANYELLPAGPSFSNSNETVTGNPSGRLGLYGWNAAVGVGLNSWFSFATDVSGYYSNSSTSTTNTITETPPCEPVACPPVTEQNTSVASNPRIYNFLFGPQFSYSHSKLRPFGHFLVGGNHMDVTRSETVTSNGKVIGISSLAGPSETSTGFTMALGGGVDYVIRRNLAWRVAADYLTNQGTDQNHVRVSTGLVWRPGS